MTYERFEMAPAWKASIELAELVLGLTHAASTELSLSASLRDALERSAIAVGNHLASGYEQGTTQAMIGALESAKGAAGEVRSMLWLMEKMPAYSAHKPLLAECRAKSEACGRLLSEWHEGVRHLAEFGQRQYLDAVREEERRRQERERLSAERRAIYEDLRRLSQQS